MIPAELYYVGNPADAGLYSLFSGLQCIFTIAAFWAHHNIIRVFHAEAALPERYLLYLFLSCPG